MRVEVASLGSYDFSEYAGSRHSDRRMPNLLWSRTYGQPLQNEVALGLVETPDEGFLLYGYTITNGTTHPWLLVTDSAGIPLWNQTYPGRHPRAFTEVSTGGYAWASAEFRNDLGQYSTWVTRINANGSIRWRTELRPGPARSVAAVSLLDVGNGDLLMFGLNWFYNVWLWPYDPHPWLAYVTSSGEALWNQTISGSWEESWYPVDMVPYRAGGYALFGFFYGRVWFGRTNESGYLLWNKTLDIRCGPVSKQECASGGFVMTATTTTYNETTGEVKGTATLARLDAEANLLWIRIYNGTTDDSSSSVVERGAQGYAIAGTTRRLGTENDDVWTAFTDMNGTLLCNYTLGGPEDEFGKAIVACRAGGYALVGQLEYSTSGGTETHDALLLRLAEPDLIPPVWRTPPTTQSIPYGLPFVYRLAAEDASGLDTWWLRDTSFLVIDQAGIVSSATSLALGAYPVTVCVNDTSGNLLEGSFTLLVLPSAFIIPGYPWTILGVIVISALVIAWRRHHRQNAD